MNDFYKIGQVIEVRGQKLRIRVFENKNSNILVYQGHVNELPRGKPRGIKCAQLVK